MNRNKRYTFNDQRAQYKLHSTPLSLVYRETEIWDPTMVKRKKNGGKKVEKM